MKMRRTSTGRNMNYADIGRRSSCHADDTAPSGDKSESRSQGVTSWIVMGSIIISQWC